MAEEEAPGQEPREEGGSAPPAESSAVLSRITVVETINCQSGGDSFPAYDSRFWRQTSGEQPYFRRFSVPDTMVPLDTGWIKECSRVAIVNRRPRYAANPSDETKAEDAARVIEISLRGDEQCDLEVPPGESVTLPVMRLSEVSVRSRVGTADVYVYVYPK